MRLSICVFFCAAMAGFSQGVPGKADILIVTGLSADAPTAFAAGQSLDKAGAGLVCRHVALEAAVLSSPTQLSERLVSLATDLGARAVVVNGGTIGASTPFMRFRDALPGVVLIAVAPGGQTLDAEAVADLVLDLDWIGRAVFLAKSAARYGIKEILYAQDSPGRSSVGKGFQAAFAAAAAESGLVFLEFPQGKGAVDFLDERLAAAGGKAMVWPGWSKDRLALFERVRDRGGFILEQAEPSLLADYPALFSYDPATAKGDAGRLLKAAERNAIELGAAGRFGVWQIPSDWVLTRAAAQIAAEGLAKRSLLTDSVNVREKISREMGGVKFRLTARIDPDTGVHSRNHYLFMEDIYVLGKGLLPVEKADIPVKYYLAAGN